MENVISVCIRLQEYPKDVASQFKHRQFKDPVGEMLGEKDAQDEDTEKNLPSEIENLETVFGFKSTLNIDCERNKSVLNLKQRIFEATGYSANAQKLLYVGRYSSCILFTNLPVKAHFAAQRAVRWMQTFRVRNSRQVLYSSRGKSSTAGGILSVTR